MDSSLRKCFGVLFAGVLLLSCSFIFAQNSDALKIESVSEGKFLGGNIRVSGKSIPNALIEVVVKDEEDSFSYSIKTNSDDQGNWLADFNQLLKNGNYYVVASQYSEGNFVSATKSDVIHIKGPFSLIIGVFSLLVILLLSLFLAGWYYSKMAEIKRYRRILLSERDIVSSYNIFKKDVERADAILSNDKPEAWKISEMKFILGRLSGNLEKMNTYVVRGINTINKYDMVNKLYDKFKIKNKEKNI